MRFDLHIHSNHSTDCSLKVDDILKQAVKKGLDGIAICDHNTVEGSLHARRRAKELNLPLLVLSGVEVSTTGGHLIILGVTENIQPNLSPQETIRIAHQKGAVVIAAHPFKVRSIGNVDGLDVDAVETFNSRCIFGENLKAKEMAVALGKSGVGGSDSHMLSTIGLGFTEIEAESDEGSVLSAIKEGRTRSGGQIAPLYVVFIQVVRGFLRRLNRLGKESYSKIFQQ
ncbi:MAG: PHP domain-containing protein [Candidatus Methanoperedens sp.]|nr:PHP domain-containing protein [Candidatus Methanoperedens sp.]MCZ7394323.1 PHP domain-containing protein [Candidatus Methanoperedens sp.]